MAEKIVEFERLDEIAVPDERQVADRDVAQRRGNIIEVAHPLGEHIGGAEHGAMRLHRLLHLHPQRGNGNIAVAHAQPVEAGQRRLARMPK